MPARIGFVFAKEQRRFAIAVETEIARLVMFNFDAAVFSREPGLVRVWNPRPGVAETKLREQLRRFRSTIVNRHEHQDVVSRGLGVFHEDIEVTVRFEQAGVEQFKFRLVHAAPPVFVQKPRVGKFFLRIFVEKFQIGVRRRGVEIIIKFLHVLAVVALGVGEAKETLLQNRVFAIPHCQRETKMLHVVAETGDAVLAPAIRAAARVVMWKIFPGGAAGRIILAHRAPLPLGKIRSPAPPVLRASLAVRQALCFDISFHRVKPCLAAALKFSHDYCSNLH